MNPAGKRLAAGDGTQCGVPGFHQTLKNVANPVSVKLTAGEGTHIKVPGGGCSAGVMPDNFAEPPSKRVRSAAPRAVTEPILEPSSQDMQPIFDTPEAHLVAVPTILAAAREIVYRGSSPLIQVPWKCKMAGLWVVIDLFNGSGGLLIALAALGIRAIVLAVEIDEHVASITCAAFPDAVPLCKVEEFEAKMLVPLLRKRKCRGVLVAGGAPCQPNSVLNKHSRGLADPRAHLYQFVPKIAKAIRSLKEAKDLQVLELLENPVGRPEFRTEHEGAMGGQGVVV